MPIQRTEEEKARIRNKHDSEKELRDKGVQFGWLSNVYSTFNVNSYEPSVLSFDNCKLYRHPINGTRVIETNHGDFYYLSK